MTPNDQLKLAQLFIKHPITFTDIYYPENCLILTNYTLIKEKNPQLYTWHYGYGFQHNSSTLFGIKFIIKFFINSNGLELMIKGDQGLNQRFWGNPIHEQADRSLFMVSLVQGVLDKYLAEHPYSFSRDDIRKHRLTWDISSSNEDSSLLTNSIFKEFCTEWKKSDIILSTL